METTNQNSSTPESHESRLLSKLKTLERQNMGYRAIQVHLSKLKPYNRKPQHLTLVKETFIQLERADQICLFFLKNADLFLLYKGKDYIEVDSTLDTLKYLFSEDPIFNGDKEISSRDFCTRFNLERDFKQILDLVSRLESIKS
ncbi:MAG: hypothetical protein VX617_04965 [Pseudomonadota bacterium]|nr:hypothetical protein [Pseudomonadota bacterium]